MATRDYFKRASLVRWSANDFGCVSYKRKTIKELKDMSRRATRHNDKMQIKEIVK